MTPKWENHNFRIAYAEPPCKPSEEQATMRMEVPVQEAYPPSRMHACFFGRCCLKLKKDIDT